MHKETPSLLPSDLIDVLKNDTELGCGNFLDKVYSLHPNRDAEFIHLQRPIRLPDGAEYTVFSLETLMSARIALAKWYVSVGVGSGNIVTLCVSEGIAPFLHYVALTSIGAVASIINPRMPFDMATEYLSNNDLTFVVVDDEAKDTSPVARGLAGHNDGRLTVLSVPQRRLTDADAAPDLPRPWPVSPSDNTLVMLSHTSGTTGVSKAVKFEHRQFFMGKRARLGRFVESHAERFLTALPQSHSSAISHLETAVLHGIPTYVLSDCMGEPVKNAIKQFEPTTVAAFPQTYASLIHIGLERDEFPSVQRWFSMGDAMHVEHIKRILLSSPQSRFIDSFGSSELGMAVFRKVSTLEDITPNRCVGRPVDIASCRIFNEETGLECQEDEAGLLAVRSPTITSGYWKRNDLTNKSWMNGYFLTGDVGFTRNGEYYLIDRAVDAINLGGAKYYTLFIEERVQKLPGVVDAVVAGIDLESQPIVCVMLLSQPSVTEKDALLRRAIAEVRSSLDGHTREGLGVLAMLTSDPRSIPTGVTGKALKRKIREIAIKLSRGHIDDELSKDISHVFFDKNLGTTAYSDLIQ